MRFTSIVAVTCAFVAGAADVAGDQGATALPPGHSEDAKATSTPDVDKVILVYGFVRHQGPIQPTKGLTLSKAIEMAGGFADLADRRKVHVSRRKEKQDFTVDVKAVLEKKPDAQDPLLYAGDQVYVSTSLREL
jgi:protein involved in polysaccharide export with SLBB domain